MAKPHIKLGRYCWLCAGEGVVACGHTPRQAYAQWLHDREAGRTNRAGWEIGR